MGLSLTMAQITGPLRNGRFVIIALLANFIIPPILALVLIQLFSLDESLAVGLLLVSLAAGAPGLSSLCFRWRLAISGADRRQATAACWAWAPPNATSRPHHLPNGHRRHRSSGLNARRW
jgi:ACR3 family arsenite efflux pump ArsB